MHENCILVLPVNYTYGVIRRPPWPHDTLSRVLICCTGLVPQLQLIISQSANIDRLMK